MAVAMWTTVPGAQSATDDRAGKYLIFQLAGEEFGVSVLKVREIMKMQEITPVPQTPAFVRGVINLRGRIVPVIDLRRRFRMIEQDSTELTCIVVVRVPLHGGEQSMGIVVDGVVEVLTLSPDDIEDAPDFGLEVITPYVRGMAKIKGKVKILLDIDQVLHGQEIEKIAILRG